MRRADQTQVGRDVPTDRVDLCVALAFPVLSVGLAAGFLASRSVTIDDGFYYLKIARQIASGAGSTFDGVHPTNGYHPLWLAVLAALSVITPPAATLRLAFLLQAFLWGAAASTIYLFGRGWLGRAAASFGALAWLAFTCRVALTGLEFSLHASCFGATALFYARLERTSSRRPRDFLLLGVLTAATFLARIETIVLAVLLAGFLAARERKSGTLGETAKRIAAFAAPVAATWLAYALVNQLAFGHFAPVSAAVKRTWSSTLLHADPRYQSGGWLVAKAHHAGALVLFSLRQRRVLLAGTAIPVLALALERRLRSARVRSFLDAQRPFVVYGAVQLGLCVVLLHGALSLSPWYFVAPPWAAAIWAGALLELAVLTKTARTNGLVRAGLAAAWCVPPLVLVLHLETDRVRLDSSRAPLERGAAWARDNLPDGAVIGAWNAGTLGYLSGRRVVNLDGVANSWEFFLHERSDLCAYFEKSGIAYLVDDFGPRGALSAVPTLPSYAACASRFERLATITGDGGEGRIEAYRVRKGSRE